jgi:predicted signal transduction protein with EAL and GGDEF domain
MHAAAGEALMAAADAALYEAKRAGRNTVRAAVAAPTEVAARAGEVEQVR